MEVLDDYEAACVIYALYEENEIEKKQKTKIRKHWVHPLNLKRPENGQFQVTFMTLRSYPEEFFKYFRMSIASFDELVSKNISYLSQVVKNVYTLFINKNINNYVIIY